MTYQKVVKVFSKSLVLNPSHTSLSDHCNSIPSSWSAIHSIEILASKFSDIMGTYRRLSQLHSFSIVSAFLSKMFDVGDEPVLTLGNCVLQCKG